MIKEQKAEIRRQALDQARMSLHGAAVFSPEATTEQIVERAKAFYDFLTAD